MLSAAVCWHLQPISTHDAAGGFLDPCSLRASSAGGCYPVCPRGDGPRLDALLDYSVVPAVPVDATIFVQVKNLIGQPIPGVPASDVWLIGCTDNLLDLSYFAFGYTSPPKSDTECIDFTCDGVVDLLDFTLFGFHYLHWC